MRKSIVDFANQMEAKLKLNDHKGGWEKCSRNYLIYRIKDEFNELMEAFEKNDLNNIIEECTDLANFCMMLFDITSNQYESPKLD